MLAIAFALTEHFVDPDVFIRSMASRGHLGGLSGATADAVLLMDAFGLDVILIETVGVGQSEIEIAELAHTTLVALQPGSGDSIWSLKAGIMEIADIFVVNKSDHPMANQMRREIRGMMEMLHFLGMGSRVGDDAGVAWRGYRRSLACCCRATSPGSIRAVEMETKRREAFAHQVRQLALGRLQKRLEHEIHTNVQTDIDPYAAADRILDRFGDATVDGTLGDEPPHMRSRATVKGLTGH